MSFDLFFHPRKDRDVSVADFLAYFRRRRNYRVQERTAVYLNNDTGVDFSWQVTTDQPVDPSLQADDGRPTILAFNLNFLRPHVFGLEAELEVSAFLEAFQLPFSDPQVKGMSSAAYTREAFLSSWNAGNEWTYTSLLRHVRAQGQVSIPGLHSMPTRDLERYWRWNLGRPALLEEHGDYSFVPPVSFFEVEKRPMPCVLWPPEIPTILPEVEGYLIPRQGLPSQISYEQPPNTFALLLRSDVEKVLSESPKITGPVSHWQLDPDEDLDEIVAWAKGLPPIDRVPPPLLLKHILNAELLPNESATKEE